MQTGVEFNTKVLLDGTYASGSGSVVFHVGANQSQTFSANIGTFSTTAMSINTIATGQTQALTSQSGAESAIQLLSNAINSVSAQRANLGAIQNRLEHTYNFVMISKENQQSAESRIRDVDFAAEMVNYTKEQIIAQAAQSMLTQANMRPQMVLQMFQ
jgi:flagellin